jgi:hypothetical protein
MNLSNPLTGVEEEPVAVLAEVPLHPDVGLPGQAVTWFN